MRVNLMMTWAFFFLNIKIETRTFYDVSIENRNLNHSSGLMVDFDADETGKWEADALNYNIALSRWCEREKNRILDEHLTVALVVGISVQRSLIMAFCSLLCKEMHSFSFFLYMVQMKNSKHSTRPDEYVWQQHTSMQKPKLFTIFQCCEIALRFRLRC